jgi:hypothetical protein
VIHQAHNRHRDCVRILRSLGIASALVLASRVDALAQQPVLRRSVREDVLGCYALYAAGKRVSNTRLFNASPSVRLDSLPASTPGLIRVDTAMFEAWDAGPRETSHGPARAVRQPCIH